MKTLARSRALAACALFVTATAGFLAPPASAHAPQVGITSFDDRRTADDFEIEATVKHDTGGEISDVALRIVSLGDQPEVAIAGQRPKPATDSCPASTCKAVIFTVKGIEYNGPYRAEVTAKASRDSLADLYGQNHSALSGTGTKDFAVLVHPAAPTGLNSTVHPETRVVSLTWNRNPEKDILGYSVQRNTDAPVLTKEPSFTDPSTANAGGKYTYKVQAVRPGASGTEGLTSNAVTAAVTVPDPPAGTTGGGGAPGGTGTGPGPGGSTGTTLAPTSPGALKTAGSIDLSGFSSIQSQARRPATRSAEPDSGFTEALPFQATDTTRLVGEEDVQEEPGPNVGDDAEVRELGAEDASNDRQRSTAFLAAGLLATVLLMHVLWIKGEVQREPLEALVPE